MIALRAARPEDAKGIAAIWNPIIRDTSITFTNELAYLDDIRANIKTARETGDAYYIAENSGAIVGFARLQPFRSGPGYVHTQEVTLHLAPDVRGQGLGRKLMVKLEDHARGAEITNLVAAISGENQIALEFHKAVGFQTCGTLPKAGRKFDRFIDLVLMQKFL